MRSFRRIAALLTATVTAAAISTIGAASAEASTVNVKNACGLPGVYAFYQWVQTTINAPTNAARGQTVEVTVSLTGEATFPNGASAGANQATFTIALGGAGSGTITATGLTNPAIPPGGKETWIGGHAQVTLANAGDVTFTPNRLQVTSGPTNGYVCAALAPVPVVATTHVT